MIEPASREELHERQISDRYLTWGWGDDENTVFAPGPALINTGIYSGTKTKQRLATQLLIVLDSTYRYPSMRRGMNGSRMSYLQSVGALIKNLDPITQNVALVRPYRGQEQFDDSHLPYFEQNFPEIKIDQQIIIYICRKNSIICSGIYGFIKNEGFINANITRIISDKKSVSKF